MTFTYDQNNLTILATPEEMAELRETRSEMPQFFGSGVHEAEAMESLLANSELEWINPTDTGDLTDAPILGIMGDRDIPEDQKCRAGDCFGFRCVGRWPVAGRTKEPMCHYRAIVSRWGYPHYAVRSFLSDLADTGKAEFISQW